MAIEQLAGAVKLASASAVVTPLKLFLASSGQQVVLAQALESKIRDAVTTPPVIVKVVPWFREESFVPGGNTLKSLIDHCRGSGEHSASDFFAVLLTGDDAIDKKGKPGHAPRDNCIFELGLFIGGLEFNPERCFMISTVAEDSLPSDLKGYTFIKIPEPADPKDKTQCAGVVEDAARRIKNRIRDLQWCQHPEFAAVRAEEILRREMPTSADGELLEDTEVILSMAAPFLRLAAANQILANMAAGIKYWCFVREVDSDKLSRFVWKLAIVNSLDDRSQPQPGLVRENLQIMRSQLSINLNPGHSALEFVIHNASEDDRAICYIRFPYQSKFLQFARFQDAAEIVRCLKDSAMRDVDVDRPFIFRPTKYFDATTELNKEQIRKLKRAINMKFQPLLKFDPALHDDLEEACFGGREDSGNSA